MNLIILQRFSHTLYVKNIPVLPKIIYFIQFLLFNSSVSVSTQIGRSSKFAYRGIGVDSHARTKIGDDCIIGHGVTIGRRSKIYDVPKIATESILVLEREYCGMSKLGEESCQN